MARDVPAHWLISTQVIKSDYFGEIALLSQPHLTYATSETFSELYELRHADVSFRAFFSTWTNRHWT